MAATSGALERWAVILPGAALAVLLILPFFGLETATGLDARSGFGALLLLAGLIGAVFAAVHHADLIAARVGEPYGTLVLTLAVTVIEVALIAAIMLSGKGAAALARDTVFAVVMIVCNGIVGLCLVLGALRYREQEVLVPGATAYLSVLVPLTGLSLVLPNYTTTIPGPVLTSGQLIFVAAICMALCVTFLFIQTVRHTDYFVPAGTVEHGVVPSDRTAGLAAALLVGTLLVIVLLAKSFGLVLDREVARAGLPPAVSGVAIAMLVLLPEGVSALKAARRDALQKSVNLALGSALATIGLSIPVVAMIALYTGTSLILGLDARDMLLLIMTFLVSIFTYATGRTNLLSGVVHLVIFAAFVFLTLVP